MSVRKPVVLAERPRPNPAESAALIRDLGIGCGSFLLGVAVLIAAVGFALA